MLIVCDVETTGLDVEDAAVVEIAAVALSGQEITDRFATLVWPGRERLQARHRDVLRDFSHIDVCDLLELSSGPETAVARGRLLDWLFKLAGVTRPGSAEDWCALRKTDDGAPKRVPLRLTSYNLEFDRAFLESAAWALGFHARQQAPVEIRWGPCVLEECRAVMGAAGALGRRPNGEWKRPKLSTACAHFEVPFAETHRALADAEAAARLAALLGLDREPGRKAA